MGNTGLTRLLETGVPSTIPSASGSTRRTQPLNEGRMEIMGEETSSTASTGSTEYRYVDCNNTVVKGIAADFAVSAVQVRECSSSC